MIFARKINKIPEFHTMFARKNARILHDNCLKNIFPRFLGGTGALLPPISNAFAYVSPHTTQVDKMCSLWLGVVSDAVSNVFHCSLLIFVFAVLVFSLILAFNFNLMKYEKQPEHCSDDSNINIVLVIISIIIIIIIIIRCMYVWWCLILQH